MTLTYIYDALCGWCYGFSPVIRKFARKHAAELRAEVVSGGMIRGGRIGPIGEVAPYISKAYQDVEQRCGVTFGERFLKGVLEEGTTVFTSVPAAVALATFRERVPGRQLDFAADLQRAIYFDGTDPADYNAYAELAAVYGWDEAAFLDACAQPLALERAEQDFALAERWGVAGFPTVVLEKENKLYALARGYVSPEVLEANYASAAAR